MTEDFVNIILADENGQPHADYEPVQLETEHYEELKRKAEANGTSFDEEFLRVIRLGMELLLENGLNDE